MWHPCMLKGTHTDKNLVCTRFDGLQGLSTGMIAETENENNERHKHQNFNSDVANFQEYQNLPQATPN